MIPQCKGKDLGKVPKSKLEDLFYASVKYDGHYVQIHKKNGTVRFYTSGGKEFYIEHIADELENLNPFVDFILEAEYIYNTDGKLGNRGKAAKLTTYRTNFEKGLESGAIPGNDIFKVFDCPWSKDLKTNEGLEPGCNTFEDRLWILQSLDLGTHCEPVDFKGPLTLKECIMTAYVFVKHGFEGLYLKTPDHLYNLGKRVNNAIKLKLRPTADLLCIDTTDGEGKYEGLIGSLVLQDKSGRIVKVGAGLCDVARRDEPEDYIGKVIEIEYEQILDTYIQPTYIGIRADKTKEEID